MAGLKAANTRLVMFVHILPTMVNKRRRKSNDNNVFQMPEKNKKGLLEEKNLQCNPQTFKNKPKLYKKSLSF